MLDRKTEFMNHLASKGEHFKNVSYIFKRGFIGLGLALKLRLFQDRLSEAVSGEGSSKVGRRFSPLTGLRVGCGHRAEIFK